MLLISSLFSTIPASAADFTWSFSTDVVTPEHNYMDIDPGIAKDGNDLWVISGCDSCVRFKGTTMDNLVQQSWGVLDGSFNRPYGDEHYWLGGLWIDSDSGKWYSTVHVEFHYEPWNSGFRHFRRIGLATSIDKGANWHYEGDIITSDNSYNKCDYAGSYYDFGCGDQKLYIDTAGGYFYIYYMTGWSNGSRIQSMRVARSPISSKMAPGSWEKWYQGSWSQPALGGYDSDVFVNADSSTVFYSTYLNKYVAIGLKQDAIAGFISTCTDLATQNWTTPERFSNYFGPNGIMWYNFPVDTNTWERMTVGQTFRLYSACCNFDGAHQTKYMNVTLGQGTQTGETWTPSYCTESVNDHNLGWDWYYGQPSQKAYKFSIDFSSTQGSRNWYYKEWNGSSYTDMTWDSANNQWKGALQYSLIYAPSQIHPDATDPVIAWNAPTAGNIDITGTVKKFDTNPAGDGVNVKIMKNGTQIWPASGWQYIAYNDTTGYTPELNVNVNQGDTIYFILNKNGDINNDQTSWDPQISYTYKLSTDISSTQGSNNWFYKEKNGSSYSNMTWDSVNNQWKGVLQYSLIFAPSNMHPDDTDPAIAWSAPATGNINITGTVKKIDINPVGDGVNVKIMKNGTQIWPASGWQYIAYNDTTGYTPDLNVNVNRGDTLYFILNKNGDRSNDLISWDPQIKYRPVYKLSSDFSSTQGSRNWYYKEWNGSSYTDMTWDSANNQWKGALQYSLIYAPSQMHPDATDPVIAWNAPTAGNIDITGTVKKFDTNPAGDGVNVKIMKNGTQIWPASGWQYIAYNDTTGYTPELNVNVNQGDTIYFILNKNGDINNDQTSWDPQIAYVP